MVSLSDGRSHERFGQVNLPTVISRADLACCHAELGMFAEGRALGEEGLRIAEAADHPGSRMFAYYGIGLLSLRQGDLPRALPQLERAVGICQDVDLLGWFPRMAAALGAAYTLSGRVTLAEALGMRPLVAHSTAVSAPCTVGWSGSTRHVQRCPRLSTCTTPWRWPCGYRRSRRRWHR
jgi:hypothetical protein